jgi:subtilisin family serine protease
MMRLRGRLVCRVKTGASPEHIASHRDAVTGHGHWATWIDGGGRIDRTLRRHSSAIRVSRAYHARRHVGVPGLGHVDYDDDEEALGLSRTLRIEIDPAAPVRDVVSDLRQLDAIEMAAPERLCRTPFATAAAAPRSDELMWGQELIGLAPALELEPGDTAIIVGLVDSGVSMFHPELSGRLRPGLTTCDLSEDPLDPGMTLVRPPPHGQDVSDDEGHGTACAGILVANGYQIFRGCAGASRLLPIKALIGARLAGQTHATAVGSLLDIDAGLKMCIDLGAHVINMSFGTAATELEPGDPIPHEDIASYAALRDCVLVAASGNQGDDVKYYPAALPAVIAVGAVGPNGEPMAFSSRGPHVAVCAPGERVASSGLDGYSMNAGTSFASPFVAGACALMVSRAMRRSTAISPAEVRTLLTRSARPFRKGVGAAGCGAGILDVHAALRAVDEGLGAT